MNQSTASRSVEIRNPQGLHMRAARLFSDLAMTFEAQVALVKGNHRVDGKSLLSVMTLGAAPGDQVVVEVSGADADSVVETLAEQLGSEVEPENQKEENPTPSAGDT